MLVSTKQFWIKLEEMLQNIPECHVHMNTRIIIKALLDEKDCKLHGHCIVYVGDQFLIKVSCKYHWDFENAICSLSCEGVSNEIFTFKILLQS
jgi:hypothetical protein